MKSGVKRTFLIFSPIHQRSAVHAYLKFYLEFMRNSIARKTAAAEYCIAGLACLDL